MKNSYCYVLLVLLFLAPSIFHPCQCEADSVSVIGIDQEVTALRSRGLEAFRRGAFEDAAASWERAFLLSREASDTERQIDFSILLARSYKAMGQYGEAQKVLSPLLIPAKKPAFKPMLAVLAGELGDIYSTAGPVEKAYEYLQQARQMASEQGNARLLSAVLNNLGNLLASEGKFDQASKAYEGSLRQAEQSGDRNLIVTALSNVAMLSIKTGRLEGAEHEVSRAFDYSEGLQERHDTAFVLTNIGLAYNDLSRLKGKTSPAANFDRAVIAFKRALAIAERIGDDRAISYSAGYLGQAYENRADYPRALEFSRRAVFSAQKVHAPESLYLWQWQTGRVLRKLQDEPNALQSYRNSIATLQSIRQEMATCYGAGSLSFRQTVEPLYLEFVDLLMKQTDETAEGRMYEANLLEARQAMESLKVAELRDYFQDDCVDVARSKTSKLDALSRLAVVVYPIVLPDRTELLVNLPSGLKKFSLPLPASELNQEIAAFRKKLEKCTTHEFLPHAQKLYRWLITPLEKDIAGAGVDTIVFVPDGSLRTIPMAALHDGKEFLISKYGLAITPGLDLTDPRPIERDGAKVLMAGLTEGVQGFPPLPYVSLEVKEIQSLYDGTVLLDKSFSSSAMEKELRKQPFSIVHIASHGKFDRDVNKSFLLTFDGRITMNNLGRYVGLFRFRQEPLELLTLSACETASGDERAALGLAGITIRAGARSAVATLWHVNDEASSLLVAEFYRQLGNPSISRAAALRNAQLKLINYLSYDHPGYWAPFLLINNWL